MTGAEIASLIKVVYAQWPRERSKGASDALASLWRGALSDMPYELAKQAVIKVLVTSKWFPKVSEIREAALDLVDGQPIGWMEAYSMARDNGYLGEGLPPFVRKTIATLGHWYLTHNKNPGTARAHFRDAYQALVKADREQKLLPFALREQLQLANDRARGNVPMIEEGEDAQH